MPFGCLVFFLVSVGSHRVLTAVASRGGSNGNDDGVADAPDGKQGPSMLAKWGSAALDAAKKKKLELEDSANAADSKKGASGPEASKWGIAMDALKDKAKESGALDHFRAAREKALKSDVVVTHGDKVMVAADTIVGSVANVFTPSKEMQDFFKKPTADNLAANPDLFLEGILKLHAFRDPKNAAKGGVLGGLMKATLDSKQLEETMDAAATKAMDTKVKHATGGIVEGVPPEVSKAALDFAKKNPEKALKLMKMYGELSSK